MTIEKLKSGSYRIGQMVDGKLYRITVDHKPTNREAVMLMAEKLSEKITISADMPFETACKAYIESRGNVISSTTKRRYYQYIKNNISGVLKSAKISAITKPMLQTDIDSFSVNHASKTVKNYKGFLLSVLNFYDHPIQKITIPQEKNPEPYIPTKEEIFRLCDEARGNMFEIAIYLASYGLRRSEICALTLDDIDAKKCSVSITKALVQDENGNWLIKPYPKTSKSVRTVPVDKEIIDMIYERGEIYTGFIGSINAYLTRTEKKLGIQHFSLHKCRHFFASYLHEKGFSDAVILDIGGWETDNVMKGVYRHSLELEKKKAEAAKELANVLFRG